jgi:uncharacterized protein (DUF1800 family)
MARFFVVRPTRYLQWALAPLAALLIGLSLLAQPNAPIIQVSDGGTVIANNGSDAYSPTRMGVDNSKTFTVTNNGNADLLVSETISVPVGFTLMKNFPGVPNALLNGTPAYTISAGTSATFTFTVALNSATAGDFSGPVTLMSNDPNNGTFTFNVTGTVLEPPTVRIVDDLDAGFTATAGWTAVTPTSGTPPFNLEMQTAPAGTGTQTATWTLSGLDPSDYHVAMTWPGSPNGATNATVTISDPNILVGGQPLVLGTVQLNQQADSSGFTDAGSTWQDLGVFTVSGSATTGPSLVVTLTDNANGTVIADAVRIERVFYPSAILDDTSPQFSTQAGTWTRVAGNGDFQKARSTTAGADGGTPTASAQWNFTVAPGQYRVVVSYAGYAGYATNANYNVFDGGTSLTPTAIQLDQSSAPTDTGGFGPGWKHLGFFTVSSNTLTVQLSNENTGSGNTLEADAVAIETVNTPTFVSTADAVRFLEQAAWGPTAADINNLQNLGYGGWLYQQLTMQPTSYPILPLYNTNNNVTNNVTTSCYGDPTVTGNPARTACTRDHYSMYPLQNVFFYNALYAPDQLNQRAAWALHKIWVISGVEIAQSAWMAPYLGTLCADAFGNYRSLMLDITLNPGMGNYLNMAGSSKAAPNENYPRELMQLFSIGLYELNPDGTQKLDSTGQPIPTYDQNLVDQMTKVFTGWNFAPAVSSGVPDYIDAMRLGGAATESPTNHDFTAKTLLRGHVQPAITGNGTTGAAGVANAYAQLNDALDNIYYHPSCAPFICQQLIQQLVTSNPTPGYVARVVDTWNRNNTAPNQMQAVLIAILLDPEARGDRKNATNYGKLKEPVLLMNNLMRQLGAQSADLTQQSDGYLNPAPYGTINMGQDVFRPPTVFSYFSPGKVVVSGSPPVIGPEFQIQNTSSVLVRANMVNQAVTPNSTRAIDVFRTAGTSPTGTDPATGQPLVPTGPNGTAFDMTPFLANGSDAATLTDMFNASMLHGTMSPDMRTDIITAVNKVAATNPRKRVHTVIYLIGTSSQYQVQR